MLDGGAYVGIASHDMPVIEHTIAALKQREMGPSIYPQKMPGQLEPERVLGMNFRCYWVFVEMCEESWPKKGIGLDIHSIWHRWYEYSMRRLDENPDVAMHIVKSMLLPWTNRR